MKTVSVLVKGDNVGVRWSDLSPLCGLVSLVYMDPPFCTQRDHNMLDGSARAYGDRWDEEIYMYRLECVARDYRDLLRPDGCMVVHLDWRMVHKVKLTLDRVFGEECFASEIVWRYRRWPSKTKNFQRVHDTLLRYVRDHKAEPRFVQLYEPLASSTRETWGDRKQRAVVANGKRTRSVTTSDPSPGVPLGDVWDIGIVAPSSRERTGYPTQKPEKLLRRLIESCTRPGDLVIDPYCGSGTTLSVAAQLDRNSIGVDIGDEAFRVTTDRMQRLASSRADLDVTTIQRL